MFEQFPYTNLHELNLDWIIKKVKEAYGPDNPPTNIVLSVNGQTGDVVLYRDAGVRFPDTDSETWNIYRIAGETEKGIEFTETGAKRIEGTHRYTIYDANNPPPYPVTSVNGQTGAVTITIPVTSVNGQMGAVILYQDASMRLPNVAENTWNIYRIAGQTEKGIEFTETGARRIEGTNRYTIYDAANPPPYPVTSVNGQTGAVTIPKVITDLASEILNIDTASTENYWGLIREVSTGTASIYLDTSNNTIKAYISYVSSDEQTSVTLPLLTSADIPSSSGVVSINGKSGVVTLYGSEIYTDPNSPTTLSQDLAAEASKARAEETKLQNSIAIIVDGDTAGQAVPVGGYAYIKNNTHGLSDGLYVNSGSAVFPATGGTADNTTFTAVAGGGMNALKSGLDTLNSKFTSQNIAVTPSNKISLGTGFTARKTGNVVVLNGVVLINNNGLAGNNDLILTIPEYARPSINQNLAMYATYGTNPGWYTFILKPDGGLYTATGSLTFAPSSAIEFSSIVYII